MNPVDALPVEVAEALAGFVTDVLSPLYARQVSDTPSAVWCPQWWAHPEACSRLDVLRRIYDEAIASGDPAMLSAWWLDHADPHMSRLLNPDGPFKYCSQRSGHKTLLAPLPTAPLPPLPRLVRAAS
jgi:hypothetical protein